MIVLCRAVQPYRRSMRLTMTKQKMKTMMADKYSVIVIIPEITPKKRIDDEGGKNHQGDGSRKKIGSGGE